MCGGGIQTRPRKFNSPAPANGGADCAGNRTETRKCSIDPCPINGGFGKWSNYSTCSVSCGGGVQFRERTCDSPSPQYGGKDCDGPSRENRSCWETECRGSFKKKFFFLIKFSLESKKGKWKIYQTHKKIF